MPRMTMIMVMMMMMTVVITIITGLLLIVFIIANIKNFIRLGHQCYNHLHKIPAC
jgi:hypothetical protein